MSCIEHKTTATGSTGGKDYNDFEAMAPRAPAKTPAERRNGKHVKMNDLPPKVCICRTTIISRRT